MSDSRSITLTVRHQPSQESRTSLYQYEFDKDEILVGRDSASDVRLPHATVSQKHLWFRRIDGEWFVVDANSTNGTLLSGVPLVPEVPTSFKSGERISVGPFELRLGPPSAQVRLTGPRDTARFARQIVLEFMGAMEKLGCSTLQVTDGPGKKQWLLVPPYTRPKVVGRGEDCDMRLPDETLELRHIEIRTQDDMHVLVNLGAPQSVAVNQKKVSEAIALHDGDEIRLGHTTILFADPTEKYLRDLNKDHSIVARAQVGAKARQGGDEAVRYGRQGDSGEILPFAGDSQRSGEFFLERHGISQQTDETKESSSLFNNRTPSEEAETHLKNARAVAPSSLHNADLTKIGSWLFALVAFIVLGALAMMIWLLASVW